MEQDITGEYPHPKYLDVTLDRTLCYKQHIHNTEMKVDAVTGCLKSTNLEDLYFLAGIAPPDIQRYVCARMEKTKQETNDAHSLYGQHPAERRLKSRNCFWRSVKPAEFSP